jgi:hypothetical protein
MEVMTAANICWAIYYDETGEMFICTNSYKNGKLQMLSSEFYR